ncbi:MAG: DMT family transporter [Planctomycetes bacterium]|nr:DMT family transporter [Planctomycetota bacterium]
MTAPTAGPGDAASPEDGPTGVADMALAAFWFAVMGLFVKLAGASLPPMQIVFARGAITLLLATWMLRRVGLSPRGNQPRLLLLRGIVGSAALVSYYFALVGLPLAEATVLQQTAPLWTAVLASFTLREPVTGRVVAALAIAFAGVLLIAQPAWHIGSAASADVPLGYALVGLLSAVLSAVAYVTVRRLGHSEDPLVVVWYLPVVTLPLSAPFALTHWVWPDARGWALLVGIGVVTQLAQLALTRGLARQEAGRATAIGYLQVAFATLFGAIVFGALPTAERWAGMALIVTSLWFAARR